MQARGEGEGLSPLTDNPWPLAQRLNHKPNCPTFWQMERRRYPAESTRIQDGGSLSLGRRRLHRRKRPNGHYDPTTYLCHKPNRGFPDLDKPDDPNIPNNRRGKTLGMLQLPIVLNVILVIQNSLKERIKSHQTLTIPI